MRIFPFWRVVDAIAEGSLWRHIEKVNMIPLTLISRLTDGLILVSSQDYKHSGGVAKVLEGQVRQCFFKTCSMPRHHQSLPPPSKFSASVPHALVDAPMRAVSFDATPFMTSFNCAPHLTAHALVIFLMLHHS